MFIIKCPWCGERDQSEFSAHGEAHIARPTNPDELTEEEFYKYCNKTQVIHFSTHGILNNIQPEYSHLAFTEVADFKENELLYVSEIYANPIESELVVLSACQTASGKSETRELSRHRFL